MTRAKQIWEVVQGMQTRMYGANLSLVAAGGAFFSMLSVFPGLAALVTLIGFFADPVSVRDQMQILADFIPADAFAILNEQIERMIRTNSSTLGWASAFSIATTLWSARQGTDALIRGVNAVYGGPGRKGLSATLLSSWMTLALIFIAVIALSSLVIVPLISTILNLPFIVHHLPEPFMAWVNGVMLWAVRWSVALVVVFLGIWLLYRFSPNVKLGLRGLFTPGALLAIVIWILATAGFSLYLSSFANYSQIYGSIGAVIALLMILYLSILAVLMGAALNAELDQVAQRSAPDDPALREHPVPSPETEAAAG